MRKRRLSRRDSLSLNRALYTVFSTSNARVDGDVTHIADQLRLRGVNFLHLMGKDRATIIREAENEWLRKKLRDQEYPIDGQPQRIYHYDGHGWLHMPLRLWLNTTAPQTPDAVLRRDELLLEIGGIIKQINPQLKGMRAKKKGWEQVRDKVKQGEQYEQPQLLSDETQGAA